MRPKHLLLSTLCLLPLIGCETPYKKSDEQRKAEKKNPEDDPAFQSFLGRLRIAAGKRDRAMLQTMMTSNFGYTWEEVQAGDSPFTYWDLHNLWPKLQQMLNSTFEPNVSGPGEFYMAAFETPDGGGYRVGMRMVNGSWRFAYFVPPPPEQGVAQ